MESAYVGSVQGLTAVKRRRRVRAVAVRVLAVADVRTRAVLPAVAGRELAAAFGGAGADPVLVAAGFLRRAWVLEVDEDGVSPIPRPVKQTKSESARSQDAVPRGAQSILPGRFPLTLKLFTRVQDLHSIQGDARSIPNQTVGQLHPKYFGKLRQPEQKLQVTFYQAAVLGLFWSGKKWPEGKLSSLLLALQHTMKVRHLLCGKFVR